MSRALTDVIDFEEFGRDPALADAIGLPTDPGDVRWAHTLIEIAKVAGHDRPAVLHERADGPALLAAIAGRAAMVDTERAAPWPIVAASGDTTYLCTADAAGNGVSLIQSNASGFGSWLAEPNTGINLHNRGLGFSLQSGHPAELRPNSRPPHTLSPALATSGDSLAAVFGTMGGDVVNDVFFTDCRVPVDNLLGTENQGWIQLTAGLNIERLILAAMAAFAVCRAPIVRTKREQDWYGAGACPARRKASS